YPKGPVSNWRPWRLGLDLVGGSHLVYKVDLSQINESDKSSVLNGLRDVIERRVNIFGVSEPQVYVASAGNESQLVVELAGIQNVQDAIKLIGETPLLDFREVEQNGTSTEFIRTNLTGRYITSAQVDFDNTTGEPHVSLKFNDDGSKIFEQMTGNNVGKPLAVFLDNNLITMPTVQQKITGGQAVITGRFSLQEANTLVERFNAGALPAPIELIDQLTISPTLGTDSLHKAIIAGGIGTLLVIVFMILYYGIFGLIASLALCIYIALTLAVFKLGVTMTLAGLAGFIITIGMAVDANILIFERVKEENKRGISRASAIQEGFRRAWPSIRDSNTSTIITAIILYFFTSSFVRGFALTLFVGTIMSMFSAITTTRLLMRAFIKDAKTIV
ncbi:MAG TPA: protein translocase subunit SecD, partial [Candidatus Paceibacterota bacterium]|nr:protein translocase subunit SecD [Candidatus Paceibacterota bacterium]